MQDTVKKKKPRVDDKEKLEARRTALEKEAVALTREAKKFAESKDKAIATEAGFKREYLRMLKYNSRLIRRLNEHLQKHLTSRDIYALSTIMSQQREVINDLRAITDLSGQVNLIYEQAVNPFMSDVTQLITDVYYQLRRLLIEVSKPKETQFALTQLDELIKQIGLGMQTSHGVLRQGVEQILVGGTENVKNGSKRGMHK